MNNKLILNVRGLKRIFQVMVCITISCLLNGKNMPGVGQGTPAVPVRRVATPVVNTIPTVRTGVAGNQAATSSLAKYGLKENRTSESLQKFLDTNRADLSPVDIREIDEHINELKKQEAKTARFAELDSKDKIILSLQKQLEQQNILLAKLLETKPEQQKGWLASLTDYESYLAQYITPGTVSAGVTAAGVSLAALGAGTTAIVALPVAASVYGLDRLASYFKTGVFSIAEQTDMVAKFLRQQLGDLGKYPTYKSRIMATSEDFINTATKIVVNGKTIDGITSNIYNNALKQLADEIEKERKAAFAAKSGEEGKEKLIDDIIASIRSEYGRDVNNLEAYLDQLEAKRLSTANVNQCRALVSEFLRTESQILLRKEADNKVPQQVANSGQAVPTTTEPMTEGTQKTWWQRWFGTNQQ